jgi:transposase
MDVYIGLDISLKTTHVCVVDTDGRPVDEGTAASDPDAVDSWIRGRSAASGWKVRLIIFETGQLSTHFHQELRDAWPVTAIDARHANATLRAQRNKTDKNDARGLAQIARTGWYKAVHVKSEEGQELRALVNGRKQLVRIRLELENHIRGTLKTFGIKLGEVAMNGFADKVRAGIEGKGKMMQQVIRTMLKARDGILQQLDAMDRKCRTLARADEVCKRLMTIPGVGMISSLAFKAEIDDPTRFRKSRDVGAHLGLTPQRFASGEVDRSFGISRCGSGYLRTLLFEAAVTMLTRTGKWSRLKAWGLELRERTGFKNASTAMARKLAVIMHRMWLDGTEFVCGDPPDPPKEQATPLRKPSIRRSKTLTAT